MIKRTFDIIAAACGLLIFSPVIAVFMFLVWRQDGHSPFYMGPRVGLNGTPFRMAKLRSMVKNADKSGVDSTGANDMRITRVGHMIRRYKLDEITQLWNVLRGDMSLVGPRPNVKRETDLYTTEERKLLSVRPGITDIASIVFSDEGDILKDQPDPDIAYNQLIRPGKSRLGILYVENASLWLDIRLILLTVVAILDKPKALQGVQQILAALGAPEDLRRIAARHEPLQPAPPPGASEIVTTRDKVAA
ncbi:MAG: sugar transferase [Rhodospirillales bacterium]|nr:sugar transferase [Alphaproteobacteria bacterium]MCB9986253.1 sugar transferase [Rhodospirillales bacterium]USO07192.1 MAG: sugar transferase [Rhodospirillales bacterium]